MSEETKNNETQQQPTQPADNGISGGEKMFTQEEVNKIVSDRLARDRDKRSTQQQEDERESVLKAREAKLDCREYVTEQKYPVELLELLDTSDVDKFKETVEKLSDIFGYKRPRFVYPPKFTSENRYHAPVNDPLRDAFKPQT
ncbi:MAG: hypothetical protein IJX37_01420 [Oscillospiraceae bacterium]|nr:hypothetical protein [Oscillospiraceae bacterium]